MVKIFSPFPIQNGIVYSDSKCTKPINPHFFSNLPKNEFYVKPDDQGHGLGPPGSCVKVTVNSNKQIKFPEGGIIQCCGGELTKNSC